MRVAPVHDTNYYLQAESLAELLGLDGIAFVRSAYATMLGREADADGERYYLHRLNHGSSKLQLLYQLRHSTEAKSFPDPLPDLESAFRQFRRISLIRGKKYAGRIVEARIVADGNTPHVRKFLQYYDEEFVRVVFLYYLSREPDHSGLDHYAGRLRRGISRQQILLDIARSQEARSLNRKALGERALATTLWFDEVPVVGTIIAILKFNFGIRRHLQDMRALQNHLYRLTNRLG